MAQARANTEGFVAHRTCPGRGIRRAPAVVKRAASSVRRHSVDVDLSVSMSLLCRIECNEVADSGPQHILPAGIKNPAIHVSHREQPSPRLNRELRVHVAPLPPASAMRPGKGIRVAAAKAHRQPNDPASRPTRGAVAKAATFCIVFRTSRPRPDHARPASSPVAVKPSPLSDTDDGGTASAKLTNLII